MTTPVAPPPHRHRHYTKHHGGPNTDPDRILHAVDHAAHLLPTQGPITVFVHHNTLHAFEKYTFDEGVKRGAKVYGCQPYLLESRYREEFERGRIRPDDLEEALREDLDGKTGRDLGAFGTVFALRLAMLRYPPQTATEAELRWVIAESDALRRFRPQADPVVRQRMIAGVREWVTDFRRDGGPEADSPTAALMARLFRRFDPRSMGSWDDRKWEAVTLHCLWSVCHDGAERLGKPAAKPSKWVRPRDALLESTGQDPDLLTHEILIPLCAAFLDQGIAGGKLPGREAGFYRAFLQSYRQRFSSPPRWLRSVRRESDRLARSSIGPLESIRESLELLGVSESETAEFIAQTLLALRGWAGMIHQMETNAEWTLHPAPRGSLVEFLAVRLILDRVAAGEVALETLGHRGPLSEVRSAATERGHRTPPCRIERRAFQTFQLAQLLGWTPQELHHLSLEGWADLIREIEAFSSVERRRVFHHAYERKYRNETLDAVVTHSRRRSAVTRPGPADYQVVCCIDEREESFRRALEEFDPRCETFGLAGFFGVAMYYRGAGEAHYTPLCPVVIKPKHYVVEEPVYSLQEAGYRRASARRRLGQATHQTHLGTRSLLGGVLTGLLGSLAAVPMVAGILFPRLTARIRRRFGRIVLPPLTQLRLERLAPQSGAEGDSLGYSVEEMAGIVEGGLGAIGLSSTDRLSPLIVFCGHGSSSLNNPHEAAHDCGACGGARGGPNARAFARMANDARVRRILEGRGLVIPDGVYFVGGYHNTCDDSMTWYDLDLVPVSHRRLFERARAALDEARKRSAHERCRRFESASLSLSTDEALWHVENRAEDLSQTRPEYGHATNSLCFVGRRDWSRGLYLDRRAFLTSYDPTRDDENTSILEGLLLAVIPVCAGISLEYYFSHVDPTGYGCGTKLPHNITSLLGVMDGAASDLRPGLPWQMVEIHEPVRLLFVIETTPEAMARIIRDNEAIAQLVNGRWVQLAVFDAETSTVSRYRDGRFEPYRPETDSLPEVGSSIDWYRGHRDHLGYASVTESGCAANASDPAPNTGGTE